MRERTADRRRLAAAVLGGRAAPAYAEPPAALVRGTVLDVTPHLLVVATAQGEDRLLFEAATTFWCGREAGVSAVRVGDDVVVRCRPGGWVAERVWVRLGRATGVIAARSGDTLEIDAGHGRPRREVVVPYRYSGRIGVRHPVLEPGYLFDAVGVWEDGAFHATLPVTTQPPFPVWDAPPRPPAPRRSAAERAAGGVRLSGTVAWYDPVPAPGPGADGGRDGTAADRSRPDPHSDLRGAAYPALDAASGHDGCDRPESCLHLPLMSIGTTFTLRNDCTGAVAALPVVECGAAAAHFCDVCAVCDNGAQGRLAHLTLMSFLALGGRPESGCFNATMVVG
ncbi:hypothetical protein ACFPZ0_12175 [Streptomonospora nanhaiensis]|uniref:Uncharacterized protein n=1 Tax=Streptomonospora nanhaiensis TaxID=1323731 RepID=A0A853BSB3_9ACTN|nr:hypothetical protein [Streptomonospora nanhaiensis]MBX9391589.1 hypothetical protein [Streptomonospora nanhaiensis]NYI97232.1 hypothetical protein [Streptomonospora nanhaiensis]